MPHTLKFVNYSRFQHIIVPIAVLFNHWQYIGTLNLSSVRFLVLVHPWPPLLCSLPHKRQYLYYLSYKIKKNGPSKRSNTHVFCWNVPICRYILKVYKCKAKIRKKKYLDKNNKWIKIWEQRQQQSVHRKTEAARKRISCVLS